MGKRKVRMIAALTALFVAICLGGTAQAHNVKRQTIWEHAVDVHRFFHNHPALAKHKVGKKVLKWHANKAYNALIWKWDGVHACEGSWTDTGDPYWGGLQMDSSFMRSYGYEFILWSGGFTSGGGIIGTADRWPAWQQMTAAERAYRSGRGFGPWPVCGAYGG